MRLPIRKYLLLYLLLRLVPVIYPVFACYFLVGIRCSCILWYRKALLGGGCSGLLV
jgi:hypothetical protein